MTTQESGRYPEFDELVVTQRPSEYLPFVAGLPLSLIVEENDDVRQLQLDFVAAHDDGVMVLLAHGDDSYEEIGRWAKLLATPLYFQKFNTHLWLLVDEEGTDRYPLAQSFIQKILQPDDEHSSFRIILTETLMERGQSVVQDIFLLNASSES